MTSRKFWTHEGKEGITDEHTNVEFEIVFHITNRDQPLHGCSLGLHTEKGCYFHKDNFSSSKHQTATFQISFRTFLYFLKLLGLAIKVYSRQIQMRLFTLEIGLLRNRFGRP